MSSVTFKQQAQSLYDSAARYAASPMAHHKELRTVSRQIEHLGQRIQSLAPSPDTETAMGLLMRARTITIPDSGKTEPYCYDLRFNTMIPAQKVAPFNAGYRALQIPMISTYNQLSMPEVTHRLNPACMHLLPQDLQQAVGSLQGKQVDLFCQTVNTFYLRQFYKKKRPCNVNIHQWAHPALQPGKSAKKHFPMGLFPIWGVHNAKGKSAHPRPSPIALGSLSPIEVISHPGNPKKNQAAMLYSPDTAHFMLSEESPFSIVWLAALDGKDRVLLSRITMLHTNIDPIAKAICGAQENCTEHDAYLQTLTADVNQALRVVLNPCLSAFEKGQEVDALKLVEALPEWHKKNIYKHAYFLKGSPQGIHASFGKEAFLNGKEIDKKYHLTPQEKKEAIIRHAQEVLAVLVDQPIQLITASAGMIPTHDVNSLQLIALAEKFEDDDYTALDDFHALDAKVQGQIFGAIWRLNGSPSGDKYGRTRFAACDNKERAQAIYLAVSSKPFIPHKSPEQPTVQPKKKTDVDMAIAAKIDAIEKLQKALESVDLIQSLPKKEHRDQLCALFEQLGFNRGAIYMELGKRANQPEKQRMAYGKAHFTPNEPLKAMLRDGISKMEAELLAMPQTKHIEAPAKKQAAPLQELVDLVNDYRRGKSFTSAAYLQKFASIMRKLGYANGGLDQLGQPEPLAFNEVFPRICQMLGLKGVTCEFVMADKKGMEQPLSGKDVAAYVYQENHFSTWIKEKDRFHLCPEFLDLDQQIEASNIPKSLTLPGLIGECGHRVGLLVRSPSMNHSERYAGKLPNINSCAFEACIHVLAKILP